MRLLLVLLQAGALLLWSAAPEVGTGDSKQQPFSIVITPVKSSVPVGGAIDIKIRLTNNSDHEINVSGSWEHGMDMSYNYDVHDSNGNSPERKKHEGLLTDTGKVHSLSPGESVEETSSVSEGCDMSTPGEYVIQLSRQVPDDPKTVVKSNKITVTVTP